MAGINVANLWHILCLNAVPLINKRRCLFKWPRPRTTLKILPPTKEIALSLAPRTQYVYSMNLGHRSLDAKQRTNSPLTGL